jgi:hypothetical protein
MSAPTTNPSAFSAFLKAANRRSGTGLPEAPVSGSTASGEAQRQTGQGVAKAADAATDLTKRILAALADAPHSLAEVSAATGLGPGAVIEAVKPLEEYRLLRRVEMADEIGFELTSGGRKLLLAGS